MCFSKFISHLIGFIPSHMWKMGMVSLIVDLYPRLIEISAFDTFLPSLYQYILSYFQMKEINYIIQVSSCKRQPFFYNY